MTPRERITRLLLFLLAHPFQFTKKEIIRQLEITEDNFRDDIKQLRFAEVKVETERKGSRYTYAILPDSQFNELRYLQPLTDAEWAKIKLDLRTHSTKEQLYLIKKLESLYDFQQLGLNALRRPALEKLNQLERGRKIKKQVVLEQYRSNSNDIRDRQIEAFLWDPELDTIQAFDPNDQKVKHFKLSRIKRIRLTDIDWQYEDKHDERPTDVFRIAMAGQKLVKLNMDVYAYNSLIDNYPNAKGKCDPGTIPNTFYFETRVNPKFLGVTNFIMNNAGHVEILAPPELKEKVLEKINILLKDLGNPER